MREDVVARAEQGGSADTDAETGAKTDEEMLAAGIPTNLDTVLSLLD